MDEVVDPQNLGSLLRTSYFLGIDGVVICSKNSAPLSPAVSKASSGALEVFQNKLYHTNNMRKLLLNSIELGYYTIGASIDTIGTNTVLDLSSNHDCDKIQDKDVILVLGNEGHGMRKSILSVCNALMKISNGYEKSFSDSRSIKVDSLNVAVSGGIILHHLLKQRFKHNSN